LENIIAFILFAVYLLAMFGILAYCLLQLSLAFLYLKKKPVYEIMRKSKPLDLKNAPNVTIQLPIFNELYVVERLLNAVSAIDYPKEKLEIQLLDDSTDETVEKSKYLVEKLRETGLDIRHITRQKRTGYKAGALHEGLKTAKGEFIAIFDADFIPDPKFLMKTISHFNDPKIGVVQTKWQHINQDYSVLTKIQALALDVHFSIEQTGRNKSGYFINFNGTAGVWRKETILDAGGWSADTLTEDLDLSYRAQLRGWHFLYLEQVPSPAELPAEINGYKSQQFRWNKGGAETAKKIIPRLLKSNQPFPVKLHGMTHLLNSSVYLCIITAIVLSVPMVWFVKVKLGEEFYLYLSFFLLATLATVIVFFIAFYQNVLRKKGAFMKFLVLFPVFLSLNIGMSLHNALAVIKGYFGKRTPFVRTPKFNINSMEDSWKKKKYDIRHFSVLMLFEGLMGIYFTLGIWLAWQYGNYGMTFIHVLAAIGFITIFYYSVKQNMFVK
jgi:cellulose synthase/poly-beta-1,6-N-acetylglucosamine synthase-like glycosyltransferase